MCVCVCMYIRMYIYVYTYVHMYIYIDRQRQRQRQRERDIHTCIFFNFKVLFIPIFFLLSAGKGDGESGGHSTSG